MDSSYLRADSAEQDGWGLSDDEPCDNEDDEDDEDSEPYEADAEAKPAAKPPELKCVMCDRLPEQDSFPRSKPRHSCL